MGAMIAGHATFRVVQLPYNLAMPETFTPSLVTGYLPDLTSDTQRAIQFVGSAPGIGTALVSVEALVHVEDNVGAAAVAPMPRAQFKRLFNEA
jgi:hypothetical protein